MKFLLLLILSLNLNAMTVIECDERIDILDIESELLAEDDLPLTKATLTRVIALKEDLKIIMTECNKYMSKEAKQNFSDSGLELTETIYILNKHLKGNK